MFNFLKDKLKRIFGKSEEKREEKREEKEEKEIKEEKTKEGEKKQNRIFGKEVSEEELKEIKDTLVENNVSVEVANAIINNISESLKGKKLSYFNYQKELKELLLNSLASVMKGENLIEKIEEIAKNKRPVVILFVGINGVGKTTTIAKIAKMLKEKGKKVVLSASDTFRAAAIEQLKIHANKLGIDIIAHEYGADPAAVAFDAIKHAKAVDADVVLIDTAGRSDINDALLRELEKVKRVAKPDITILVAESLSGNSIMHQAKTFNEKIGIDGLILTKCDIDEKGGAIISASYVTGKPIYFLATGQDYNDLISFDPKKMAEFILKED